MASRIVRIESITIDNFKNVTHGTLDFENKRKDYKASVLGLFCQNGSGRQSVFFGIGNGRFYRKRGQNIGLGLQDFAPTHKYARPRR